MNPTGRRVVGPSADLVEVDDGQEGLKHTALVYHERYRTHETLNSSLELVEPVLACPLVTGIVEVSSWDRGAASFLYPTGTAWTITEVVRAFRDGGQSVDPRTVVEMLYLAGLVVADASETLPEFGVYSHGSLSPLRVLMKADGQVQLIGYGIPQVEIMAWRENEANVPHEDAFRYCPPERFEGLPEDGDSDLYCLALCAYELLTTEFMYDGTLEKIKEAARKGEADKKVNAARQIPTGLRQLLAKSLANDPDRRIKPSEFVAHVEALLGDIQGTSLADTMVWVSQNSRRGKALGEARGGRGVPQKGGDAAATVRAAGAGAAPVRIVSGAQRPNVVAEGNDGQSRWGKPVRRQEEVAEEVDAPIEERPSYVRARPRVTEAAPAAAPAAEPAASGTVEARQALRDRLKKKDTAAEPAAAPTPEPAVADARAALRERLKSKGAPAETAAPPPPVEVPAAVDPADARAALRERLKAKQGGGEKPAEAPKAEPVKAEPVKAEAPAAEEAPADARQSLRDRLRKSQQVETAPVEPEAAKLEAQPKEAAAEVPSAEAEPEPETAKPETAKPEATKAEAAKAEAAPPEAKPEAAKAEAKPDAAPTTGSLRDRLKARDAAAAPAEAAPEPAAAAAPAAAADGARPGESLRDRLKRQKEESAATPASAPTPSSPATPAAVIAAADPAKGGDEDPREALRRKLRERRGE